MCNGLFNIADVLSCPESRHFLSRKAFCFKSSPTAFLNSKYLTFFGEVINIDWMSNA